MSFATEKSSVGLSEGNRLKRIRDFLHGTNALLRASKSISFSQYGEDLLLGLSLFPRRSGFYVDVGAYHPWRGSNTYKLYLRGWRGLTIEPNPEAAPIFRRWRPRDRHVTVGIARESSTLEYHEFRDKKLNTFSPSLAVEWAEKGYSVLSKRLIDCRPLRDIIDRHSRGTQIDLLSIDCEGLDYDVLQTVDFDRNRPVALLIEDFEEFSLRRYGKTEKSLIRQHLEIRDYRVIGQGLFSMLYVDSRARQEGRATAFRADDWQFT
jgi:FkbM family methyltransferase